MLHNYRIDKKRTFMNKKTTNIRNKLSNVRYIRIEINQGVRAPSAIKTQGFQDFQNPIFKNFHVFKLFSIFSILFKLYNFDKVNIFKNYHPFYEVKRF